MPFQDQCYYSTMTDQELEEKKRQLQKLIREYDANKGMAGFVCSRPVELMPQAEQDRLINGFCTPQNIQILAASKQKLIVAKDLPYAEDADREKIENALPILDSLVESFSSYMNSRIDRGTLRDNVRSLLEHPIPDTVDGLTHSLTHLIETISFLSDEPLDTKDSWDRMVDCVQMHDALSRARKVCASLQSKNKGDGSLVVETIRVTDENVDRLEGFFKGTVSDSDLEESWNASVLTPMRSYKSSLH